MSLIGLVRGAIEGKNTWADVESKFGSLAKTGALDVLEAAENLANAFMTNFVPAEGKSLATDAPAALATLATQGLSAAEAQVLPEVVAQTEQNAETAAGSALASVTTGAAIPSVTGS